MVRTLRKFNFLRSIAFSDTLPWCLKLRRYTYEKQNTWIVLIWTLWLSKYQVSVLKRGVDFPFINFEFPFINCDIKNQKVPARSSNGINPLRVKPRSISLEQNRNGWKIFMACVKNEISKKVGKFASKRITAHLTLDRIEGPFELLVWLSHKQTNQLELPLY